MAICDNCGKEFDRPANSKARFCSVECRFEGMAKARAEKEKQCKYCGKRFKGEGAFCSKEHQRISEGIRCGSGSLYLSRMWKK